MSIWPMQNHVTLNVVVVEYPVLNNFPCLLAFEKTADIKSGLMKTYTQAQWDGDTEKVMWLAVEVESLLKIKIQIINDGWHQI